MLLEVRDLQTKFFTVDGVVNAVNGISYSVDRGECLAIVGESGSGKTVGVLSILGSSIAAGPHRRRRDPVQGTGTCSRSPRRRCGEIRGSEIAIIFQDPMTSLNPVMTDRRPDRRKPDGPRAPEPAAGARSRGDRAPGPRRHSEPASRLDDYPHQFSGGMRQRVMIAMALACSPELIIADEPTTALDVTIQAQIVELVKRLQAELGTAVIWITHDLGVVARLADRVAVMYAGHIVEEAPVDELYASPAHPYTRGLLNSLPRLDAQAKTKLRSHQGSAADLVGADSGAARSRRAAPSRRTVAACENPALDAKSRRAMRVACWHHLLHALGRARERRASSSASRT